MSNTKASLFTGGKTENFERQKEDFYATPYTTTEGFLKEFNLGNINSVLEPSVGMGHMAKVIKEFYPNIDITCCDIVDRGYPGTIITNFLEYDFDKKFDVVITNPPFKLAKEFVEKGLDISNKYVIMTLKVQFLESISRKEFLKNSPLKYVYVHSERQSCMRDGEEINPNTGKKWSSALLLCWFVWEVGYEGEPIIRWI